MPGRLVISFAFVSVMLASGLASAQVAETVGDVYELRSVEESEFSSASSSGSSESRNVMIERVIAVRGDGSIELEFDLPKDTSAEDRSRNWRLPIRVLKRPGETLELLDREALAARNRAWLQNWKIPESACGHWVFTWTAFKIECDPEAALASLTAFDLRPHLSDGALYTEAGILHPVPLQATRLEDGRLVYRAELEMDPEAIRLSRAEQAVAIAEMTGQPPLPLEKALEAASGDSILGKLAITFEVDEQGQVTRCVRVAITEITGANSKQERNVTTTTIERRKLPSMGAV